MKRWFARQEPPPGSQMKGKGKAELGGLHRSTHGLAAGVLPVPVFYWYRCFHCAAAPVLLGGFFLPL